ncbi:MAG: PEP-CTERM sorting domain-containing protein [Sedimentisphaeraceae bacterium JB056]
MFKYILSLCVVLFVSYCCYGVTSTFDDQGNTTYTNGASIDEIIGADVWHTAGYYGSTVNVANVEAGLAADTFTPISSALASTDQYYYTPATGLTTTADFYDLHATQTSTAMAGRSVNPAYNGIASQATLYSGAVATAFGESGSFSVSDQSVYNGYSQYYGDSKNISVINSSWGGSTYRTTSGLIIDALAYNNTTTLQVFSAGNSGPAENTVSAPGVNSLVVGASANGNETANSSTFIPPTEFNTYDKLASFSSIGPSNWTFFRVEEDGTQNLYGQLAARASVDLIAPGSYIATTGDMTGSSSSSVFGTSYSAPITAGAAALMVDYANQNFTGNTHSEAIDARVLKATMMNSCDKNEGWDNMQSVVSIDGRDVIGTGYALDFKTGAGVLNMENAYSQYTQGQTGIEGTSDGSGFYVQAELSGWDLGKVSLDGSNAGYYNDMNNMYVFEDLTASYHLTATLSWFRATEQYMDDVEAAFVGNDLYEADLDMGIYYYDDLVSDWVLMAVSASSFSLTEHLDFTFDAEGDYAIGVLYEGNAFDNTLADIFSEDYALAWNLEEVPEPITLALIGLGSIMLRRKKC